MISIGFSTSNSWVSRIVRWFTKSIASHSFIMFDWLGQQWVLASEWDGVKIVPLPTFLAQKNIIVKVFDMPEITMDELKLALDDTGVNYDYSGLFGAMFPIFGTWLRMKWHNPWNDPKAMFCSEFITIWLKQLGYPATSNVDPADVTPERLIAILSAQLRLVVQ
jgi:hypothetical protein